MDRSPDDITAQLTNVQTNAISWACPQVPSGTVALVRDENWGSQRADINIDNYQEWWRHQVPSSLVDAATWLCYNLPVGTVVTLSDHIPNTPESKSADLSGHGRTIDLVGRGYPVPVDLNLYGLNDKIAGFFWRKVDLSLGAIELFEHPNFQGCFQTIFLSEWNPNKPQRIDGWDIQDCASSVKWRSLFDRQTALLHDNWDGTGNVFAQIQGWGNQDNKQHANLPDTNMNDRISAFTWIPVVPKREIIQPFNLTPTLTEEINPYTETTGGTNESTVNQKKTLTLTKQNSQTVTVTTTDKYATGIKTGLKVSGEGKVGPIGGKSEWSLELSFSYERTNQRTTTATATETLSQSFEMNIPPRVEWKAQILAKMGKVREQLYETTAERWYDQPVTGSVQDPSNNNWYKRTEKVRLALSAGALSTENRFDFLIVRNL